MRSISAPASALPGWRWRTRVAGLKVTLVEIDPALAALADENARLNGLADRVRALTLDVTTAGNASPRRALRRTAPTAC